MVATTKLGSRQLHGPRGAQLARLKEEVHASLRPVHAAVALGKQATAAEAHGQGGQQFMEVGGVGNPIGRRSPAHDVLRLSQASCSPMPRLANGTSTLMPSSDNAGAKNCRYFFPARNTTDSTPAKWR